MLYFVIGVIVALCGFGMLMIFGRFYNARVKRKRDAEEAAKDPYWKQFHHAYGEASDLPAFFDRMRAGDEQIWRELWQRLCHQGQAFTDGSIAAIPVLVDYASSIEPAKREPPLSLVAAITADAHHIDIPPQLVEPFAAAVDRARALAIDSLREATTEQQVAAFVTMIAVADGLHVIGSRAATLFFTSELELVCPHCESEFVVDTKREPWEVQTFDFEPVAPVEPPQDATATGRYAAMARERGQDRFAEWLENLQSLAKCPHCGERTTVLEGLKY